MSIYYNFYLAKKIKDTFVIVAPFEFNPDEDIFDRVPLESRHHSNINWSEFRNFMLPILPNEIHDYDTEFLLTADAYACPVTEMALRGAAQGLRQGYVKYENFKKLKELDYVVNSEEDYEMIPPEVFAEMDPEERKGYGKVGVIAVKSTDYIANKLLQSAYRFIDIENANKYYFICKRW